MTTVKPGSEVLQRLRNNASSIDPSIQTGLDRFPTLIEAWDWHIGLGRDVEIRERIDRETRQEVLESFAVTNAHRSKKYRVLRTITAPRAHPEWEQMLLAMAGWALLVEVLPRAQGSRIAIATPLLPGVHELVKAAAERDFDRKLLHAFLTQMAMVFAWLPEEWRFLDPASARSRWLHECGYQPAAWFAQHLAFQADRIRSAGRAMKIRSQKAGRARLYLTSDVAKYSPKDFTLEVLQDAFPEFPAVATIPRCEKWVLAGR